MAQVVKILVNDDGAKVDPAVWCFVNNHGSGQNTLCKGEYFGFGESGCKYEIKENGRVTCSDCLDMIREIKKYRL